MSWHRNAKHHPPKWNLPTGLDRMGWHNYTCGYRKLYPWNRD